MKINVVYLPGVVLWHVLRELGPGLGSLSELLDLDGILGIVSLIDDISMLSLHSEGLEFVSHIIWNVQS